MPGAVASRIPVAADQRYPRACRLSALARVVSVALTYLPYASLGLVAYAVWRTAMLGRLSAGAHIGAGQAKVLVLVCTVIVVLQSASLSFARGDDRPPDFQADSKVGATD